MNFPLKKVLLCAACEIAVHGWKSSTEAKKASLEVPRHTIRPTSYWVSQILQQSQYGKAHQELMINTAAVKNIDLFDSALKKEVTNAIEWAKNIDLQEPRYQSRSMYFDNIKHIATQQANVELAQLGYAVSILREHLKHTLTSTNSSRYLGTLGEKFEGTATITDEQRKLGVGHIHRPPRRAAETYWLYKAVTVLTGSNIVWFTNTKLNVQVGDKILIRGYIKTHEEFRGEKATRMNRVTIISAS